MTSIRFATLQIRCAKKNDKILGGVHHVFAAGIPIAHTSGQCVEATGAR